MTDKACRKCGELKPLDQFYMMAGMRDGHRHDCKVCNLLAKQARYRADPEPYKQRTRQWQQDNADRYAETQRRFRESGRKAVSDRKSHLKRKFGITIEQYEEMLVSQDGGCAICGRLPETYSLHVDHDHDHESGRVRGLLCFRCNNARDRRRTTCVLLCA